MKRAKYWIILAVIVVVAVAAWYVYGKKEATQVTYRFGKVDRGDVVISISATGTLAADTTVQVGTQVSGTINRLFADFNSHVKQGQLLALLDTTFLQAALEQQSANRDRAQATLNDAQRTFNRSKDLFTKGLIAQADLDAATTAVETSQASLRQAQAALYQARVNLNYATIKSPINGIVISRNVDVGQTVAASLSAPTIFQIANDLSKMQVQASVDEADIGSVKDGQNVTFRVDAHPDDTFAGTVRQIRLAPITSSNVVTYTVIIDVENPDLKLMPGMTATVTIEVARADDVIRVPIQAIKFTPADFVKPTRPAGTTSGTAQAGGQRPPSPTPAEGGAMAATPDSGGGIRHRGNWNSPKVWVLQDGAPRPVRIEKGIQNTTYVAVMDSSLKEGDSVIVGSSAAAATTATQQGTNPFMPRMGGGPGGTGGPRR